MILIFDDNKYRLENLCKKLRLSDFYVKGESYEYCEYITKPLVTILVSPKPSEIQRYLSQFSKEDTLCIFVVKRETSETKNLRNVIIDENCEINSKQVSEIINREFNFNLKHDLINYILIDEEEKDIYFGNKKLYLLPREYQIVRFFAYNRRKMFTIDEIFEYMKFQLSVNENTFSSYISKINSKCYKQKRENIILRTKYGYGITNVTGKFIP